MSTIKSKKGALKMKKMRNKTESKTRKQKIMELNALNKDNYSSEVTMKTIAKFISIRPRVIVSFTSIPSRINKIQPFLEALRNQTYKPDKIYLNIPKFCKREKCGYTLENEILKYSPFITFNYIETDYGPLTKLVGVFEHEIDENTIIITLDDDKDYDKFTIENLVVQSEMQKKHEIVCAVGRRGWILKRPDMRWPNFSYLPNAIDIKKSVNVDVLTGVGGVAYRRGLFKSDFPNMELVEKCFKVDDIYINGYLAKNGIQRILIPSTPNIFMKTIKNTHLDNTYVEGNPLWDENKNGKNNNRALELFKTYFQCNE